MSSIIKMVRFFTISFAIGVCYYGIARMSQPDARVAVELVDEKGGV